MGGKGGYFLMKILYDSASFLISQLPGRKDSCVKMGGSGVLVFHFEWKVVIYGYQQGTEEGLVGQKAGIFLGM